MGDPVLAETMRKAGVKAPVERIIRTDQLATCYYHVDHPERNIMLRIVDLECGHKILTKNWKRAQCHECHEMILNGEDYVLFRYPDGLPDG